MEDKKAQNIKQASNHSSTETYHTKPSKQKKCSSLSKRRNTAIALSVISSVILAGIGYEVVTSLKGESKQPLIQDQAKAPLRILSEEEDYIGLSPSTSQASDIDFDEEVNIIQQLTRHKNLQAKKIRELKEDLEEARARIVQLKTDILIKGGEKEQYYTEQIEEFNKQLSNFDQQNSNLQAEIAIRDKLINSKKLELERISKIFTDTHEKLESELTNRESEIEQQMLKTQKVFDELKEELALTDTEIQTPEDVREVLQETTHRIAELEAMIEEASNDSLEANKQAEDIANRLLGTERELADARETIQNLVLKIETQDISNLLYENKLEFISSPDGALGSMSQDLGSAHKKLLEKQQELERVERRLQQALVDYTSEKSRADELFSKIKELEASSVNQSATGNFAIADYQHGPGNARHIVQQQDRLIKDLQRNLKSVEQRNKDLEQLLGESMGHAQEYASDQNIKALKLELSNSQEKARELEAELHELRMQQNYNYATLNSSGNSSISDDKLEALLAERNTLLAQVYEYQSDIQDQQNTIIALQESFEEAISSNREDPSPINNEEIQNLRNQISILEKTLSETEKQLQQAVSTARNTSSADTSLVEMEEFYETKLSQLAKTNMILEEQLEEAEEYIELTQQQLLQDQKEISSLHDQVNNINTQPSTNETETINRLAQQLQNERNQRLSLEKELAQLRDRFHEAPPQVLTNQDKATESQLKKQLKELQFLYEEQQKKSSQLETELETLSQMAVSLKEEMAAHEAAISNGVTSTYSSKLRAKIAYLATRLSQEKSKLINTEEKLQEMMHEISEMRERNQKLEQQLHYR